MLDFEATCDEPVQRSPMEVIEFPTVVVDTQLRRVVDTFHRYIRPVVYPTLTPFCTRLTGIEQATVDAADTFQDVFRAYVLWLETRGYMAGLASRNPECACVFVTCGDWDLKTMLPNQAALTGVKVPAAFRTSLCVDPLLAPCLSDAAACPCMMPLLGLACLVCRRCLVRV